MYPKLSPFDRFLLKRGRDHNRRTFASVIDIVPVDPERERTKYNHVVFPDSRATNESFFYRLLTDSSLLGDKHTTDIGRTPLSHYTGVSVDYTGIRRSSSIIYKEDITCR